MSRIQTLADRVHARLNDATVKQVVGERNRGRNDQRRRIHWYRSSGEIISAKTAGGTVDSDGDDVTGQRVDSVWTRLEMVTCLVFAESEDSMETLLDNLITAIDQSERAPAVEWEGYEWSSTTKDEFSKRIPMIELTFSIRLPVADAIKQLVEITDEELTCEIDEDL